MIGRNHGRKMIGLMTLGAFGLALPAESSAQFNRAAKAQAPASKATAQPQPQAPAEPKTRLPQEETLRFQETAIPVNPTDPIAIVNNEVITRRELADEAVVRKGQEILDTLIARRLIDQALKTRKLEVTAAEIDAEIDDIAMRMAGIGREAWLRTLDKDRGISPAQYARDIIYPSLALKKLAAPRVQVTQQDMKDAFEANFGERLQCRIIMTDRQRTAIEIWEKLKANPGGFEKIAKDQSKDTATAALGGMLPEPIARHAHPRTVSDAAFQQLVDGDPKDTDKSHKPKDGDITGPIQVDEMVWVIIKRESLNPAKQQNPNDPAVLATLRGQMYEVKLQEAIKEMFTELMRAAAIDNRLTGAVKLANEHEHPAQQDVGQVKLMNESKQDDAVGRASTSTAPNGAPAPSARPAAPAPSAKPGPTPAGMSPEVANSAERLRQTLSKPK